MKMTESDLQRWCAWLEREERSGATVAKYRHDGMSLLAYLAGAEVTPEGMQSYKRWLSRRYRPASANSMLVAANSLLGFLGRQDCRVKLLKTQRRLFCGRGKELGREEYERLIRAAEQEGNTRLSLVMQTICATGIRVSELCFITKEAVDEGTAVVSCKGKQRVVLLPKKLRRVLKGYCRARGIEAGPVFITKGGAPLDRSNVWSEMKRLCRRAGVAEDKVFPHNLRHLFARVFYQIQKDIVRLADVLGHSSIETTRIYTASSGTEHARQLERMNLILT